MADLPAVSHTAVAVAPAQALSLQDLTARADLVVKAGLAPDKMTPPQLAVIMLKGQELGLTPLEAMESLYVVNGRVGQYTHQYVTELRQAGHDYRIVENTPEACTVIIYRRDGTNHRHTLTFKECQEAGWTNKPTWKGAGQRTMLAYRTISQAIRLYCPEVIHQVAGRAPMAASGAPQTSAAEVWYAYTRQLLASDGLEGVIAIVTGMADELDAATDDDYAEDGIADDGVIDGQVTDISLQSPPPTSSTSKAPPTRPYPPETVRAAIASRVAKGSPATASQGVRGATVHAVEGLFHERPPAARTHMRHQLTTYLLGKGQSAQWTHGECETLLKWARERTADGDYLPNAMACREAEAIVALADEQNGQQELPL